MPSRSLEQTRVLYALETIQAHVADRADDMQRYATLVRSLPTTVLHNGLPSTLASLLADSGPESDRTPAGRLFHELQEWLLGPVTAQRPERVYQDGSDLMQAVAAGSRPDFQRAQESALLLLGWMRKFADAYLPKGDR